VVLLGEKGWLALSPGGGRSTESSAHNAKKKSRNEGGMISKLVILWAQDKMEAGEEGKSLSYRQGKEEMRGLEGFGGEGN